VETIDLIEYDGTNDCEYDFYQVDVRNKKSTVKTPKKTDANGANNLIMQAENLGTRGNNTAAIKIDDGVSPPQTVVLNSDMGKSEVLRILAD
jgi:hypothetical protein